MVSIEINIFFSYEISIVFIINKNEQHFLCQLAPVKAEYIFYFGTKTGGLEKKC